jgi:hypothetical protein
MRHWLLNNHHIVRFTEGPMPSYALPDIRRIRSYFLRLPLATRAVLFALVAFYIAQLFSPGLDDKCALIPLEINLQSCMFLSNRQHFSC